MNIEIHNHSDEVLAALQEAAERALETCGLVAEGYAKRLVPSPGKTGTGALKNSITHKVDPSEPAVYIGIPMGPTSYGIYVELGTGQYYPGGRPTPWKYQDAKGNWHWTKGNPARPYLKPAVADHTGQYRKIIEDEFHGR